MRFVNRWKGPSPAGLVAVRAWLRRPGLLRVERLDGTLDLVVREERPRSVGMALTVEGGRPLPPRPMPGAVRPVYDVDGLVEQRPEDVDCDDPIYQSYDWVAMLDPVELADGADPRLPPSRQSNRRSCSTSWWRWTTGGGRHGRRVAGPTPPTGPVVRAVPCSPLPKATPWTTRACRWASSSPKPTGERDDLVRR